MNRTLVLFGIGMVFGGGIGFLVAASYGVTLDGHDHSAAADAHSAHAGMDHANHDMPLVLDDGPNAPALNISVIPDPMSGWNLQIKPENFRFAPENASKNHVAGEGHAHIYVNGQKVARHYGSWFHIAALPKGENTIKVELNANDHRALMVGDTPVAASITVEVD